MKNLCRQQGQGSKACGTTLPKLSLSAPEGGGGAPLPYKRLMGMCRWMGYHFHDCIDYNRVTFSIELLVNGVTHFSDFWDKAVLNS